MLSIKYVGQIGRWRSLTDAILDAIFNILNRSMMSELDSSITMPEQQKSTKKKTLKPSSRSYWFSTGLSDPACKDSAIC